MKPAYGYYGGKQRLAARIVQLMPEHDIYLEPFFGSGAVFFAKTPSRHEVINDLSDNVVTFLRVLRDRPDDLQRVCELTPHARTEYARADLRDPTIDDLERARRFWVRVNQGFGRLVNDRTGWSLNPTKTTSTPATIANRVNRYHALSRRLMTASIECCDAPELIERIATPTTLIYADPPYLDDTRATAANDYEIDMSTADEHCRLAETLNATSAKVILSGYPSPLYSRLYAGWRYQDIDATRWSSRAATAKTERLWFNFEPAAQLSLIDLGAVDGRR